MIIGIEIAMAVIGILALVRGKMTISKHKVVLGVPARLLGLLALTPLPVAFVLVIGFIAMKGPADPEKFAQDNKLTITAIEAITVIGLGVVVFGIGAVIGVDPAEAERLERRRRRRRYEEEDDFEEDDYEEEDRSQRRPRREWER